MNAYAEGKPIEWRDDSGNWNECKEREEMYFVNHPSRYRVKHEEKPYPLDYNTLIKHFKESHCTLIKDVDDWVYNILGFNQERIKLHKISTDSSFGITYKELLKYKWLTTDKPCGILMI